MKQKILLIKRAALGDILMATPLIRQLKQKVPNLELDFLVSNEFASVLNNNPYIDNLITLPSETFSLKKIFTLISYASSLRGKYDYVFILDKHYYFNFIGRIICKKVVGYVREHISQIFLRYFVKYNDVMRYHGLYYLDLLTASGLAISDYTDYKLDFKINEEIAINLKTVIDDYKLVPDEFIIIVNSGGNNQFESGGIRMLPQDKVLRLIQLAAKQRKVVLLGGKVDEINYNNYLKNVHMDNVINLAGKLSLQQSAILMRSANKIYTTDCGAMHIAISQNLYDKLCCFFGPTCPNHVLPPNMGIEYYWDDNELFDRNYPLYGLVPNKSEYFRKLDIDKLFIDNTDETKKLY